LGRSLRGRFRGEKSVKRRVRSIKGSSSTLNGNKGRKGVMLKIAMHSQPKIKLGG